jgi:hypothetical protein
MVRWSPDIDGEAREVSDEEVDGCAALEPDLFLALQFLALRNAAKRMHDVIMSTDGTFISTHHRLI